MWRKFLSLSLSLSSGMGRREGEVRERKWRTEKTDRAERTERKDRHGQYTDRTESAMEKEDIQHNTKIE